MTPKNLNGDTGKQALKHICQRFFNFTAQRTFCTVLPPSSILKNKKDGKTVQNVRFAVQNVHCAVMLGQI